jgi:hypothetical protein
MLKDQSKESRDSPINELAASIASKLARNTPAPSDPLKRKLPYLPKTVSRSKGSG